jgi:hypothetical protein
MDWPAGPAEDSEEAAAPDSFTSHHTSPDADSSQLSTSFPPNLPGLLTTHARSGSEELNLHEAESSRASSRIPAHSALSRMLQENSAQEHGLEEVAAWSLGAGGTTQRMHSLSLCCAHVHRLHMTISYQTNQPCASLQQIVELT